MRSEFAEVPFCKSADEYVAALLAAIHRLWAHNGFLPESTRLLDSYEYTESAKGAYVRSVVDCADDFWSRIHYKAPSTLSPYASSSPDYAGLEFSHQFVKLVPRPEPGKPEVPPNHPSVYFGLLLHQHGKEAECKEFCEAIKQEECDRAAEAGRPMGIFGLRPPLTAAEEVVCPHLLLMTVSTLHLGHEVTTYGLLASPGSSLLVRGAPMACLVYRVAPMDDAILARAFVLPCTQRSCTPIQRSLQKPMWQARDTTVEEFHELFGGDHPCPDDSPVLARKRRAAVSILEDPRPPTAEERAVTAALGVPLGCPAFCVGDIYNVLREQGSGDGDPLCAFLLAAIAKHGSHCPVNTALALSADALNEMDRVVASHGETVKALKQKLEESELRVETLENRLERKRKREADALPQQQTELGEADDDGAKPKAKASKSVAELMVEMNNEDCDDPQEDEQTNTNNAGEVVVVAKAHDHASLEEVQLLLGAIGMTDDTMKRC